MRVIKPQPLGVLYRPMEIGDRFFLSVGVLALFHVERPGALFHEAKLWQLVAEELGTDVVLDEGLAKPGGEIMVEGHAYPPSPPQPACDVRVRLGPLDKTLRVIGEREWGAGGVASEPVPFSKLPIDWSRAYGGPGLAENPSGVGAARVGARHPLPNIMRPGEILRSPTDRVDPAGFSAVPLQSPLRMKYAGTYDARWVRERSPSPPTDRDLRLFHQAPRDQWLSQPLRGDERLIIENMHPTRPCLEGQLPGVRVRCLVSFDAEAKLIREQPIELETVRLFPHRELGIAIFRGIIETTEDDADDIALLLVAAEAIGDPRPLRHYQAALRDRLDPEHGAMAWLEDHELLPLATCESEDSRAPWDDPLPEGRLEKRLRARAALELEALRAKLSAEGIDPDAHGVPRELPPSQPPVAPRRIHEEVADAEAQAQRLKQQAENEARAACRDAGADYDVLVAQARAAAARPPTFSAAATFAQLEEQLVLGQNAGVALPAVELLREPEKLKARLNQQEAVLHDVYRRFAHEGPAPDLPVVPDQDRLRETIRRAVQRGDSLSGVDLTGADLRGLTLTGANLAGAYLAGATFDGCDLSRANLDGAVFAFARGRGACLSETSLNGTNFGEASLPDAALDRLSGREPVLSGADLSGASLDGSVLAAPALDQTKLDRASGEQVTVRDVIYGRGISARAVRLQASIEVALLMNLDAREADLSNSSLTRVGLVDPVIEQGKLVGVQLDRCAFAGRVEMTDCDLSEATITQTSLARAQLGRSSFRQATLDGADFSRANLRGASLYRARARKALFSRAKLANANAVGLDAREAVLDRTELRGTDLTGAHLFGASMVRVDADESTRLDDAITERAQISLTKKGGT